MGGSRFIRGITPFLPRVRALTADCSALWRARQSELSHARSGTSLRTARVASGDPQRPSTPNRGCCGLSGPRRGDKGRRRRICARLISDQELSAVPMQGGQTQRLRGGCSDPQHTLSCRRHPDCRNFLMMRNAMHALSDPRRTNPRSMRNPCTFGPQPPLRLTPPPPATTPPATPPA